MKRIEEYKIILLLVVMAIAGSTSAFFKIGLRELSPDLFTIIRFVLALIFFLPYLLKQETQIVKNKKRLIFISLIAAANVTVFIFGLNYTTAIISGMLYACVPLITAVFSWLIIKEKVSPKKWLGIFIGIFGVLVIILPSYTQASASNGSLAGNLIILLAVMFFCLYSVVSKKYSNEYSPATLTKYFILTTLATQFFLLIFHVKELQVLTHISLQTWLSVAYCGILGTALYYFLYQYVIKQASPVLAATTFFLQPLAGVGWTWLLLGEKVTETLFIGTILIFFGMGIVLHEQYLKAKN